MWKVIRKLAGDVVAFSALDLTGLRPLMTRAKKTNRKQNLELTEIYIQTSAKFLTPSGTAVKIVEFKIQSDPEIDNIAKLHSAVVSL